MSTNLKAKVLFLPYFYSFYFDWHLISLLSAKKGQYYLFKFFLYNKREMPIYKQAYIGKKQNRDNL